MQKLIYPNLGGKRKEVLVGPSLGLDTCVIQIDGEKVLVASTDPLSLIPQLGTKESAWMSVNLLVNDLVTSGLEPKYLMVDLNLPPDLPDEILAEYWQALSKECERLGISIVGGNTGKFEGCSLTIIGSGTTFTTGLRKNVIVSSGAKVRDKIIVTKGAAISTTGLLSKMFPNRIRKELGEQIQKKAEGYFEKISSIKDALTAASVGAGDMGVTAMHDVAEGGVFASMSELAAASSLGMKITKSKIPVSPETRGICDLFGIDPYWSLGEGAMVVCCNPEKSKMLIGKLAEGGIHSAVVGEMASKAEGVILSDDKESKGLTRPPSDPYWNAYYSAVSKKWD